MRAVRVVLAVALALSVMVVPGQALAGVAKIKKIYFDPPGSDTLSNRTINQEKVVICNRGAKRKGMSRWRLDDKEPFTSFASRRFSSSGPAVV